MVVCKWSGCPNLCALGWVTLCLCRPCRQTCHLTMILGVRCSVRYILYCIIFSPLQFSHILPIFLTMVRRVRCTVRYSSYSISCSDYDTQSSVYSTLQFIFHQLFWLVRIVRCTVLYSSYSTSCSDWYAEFGVLHATVHIPPVVLTGTQSSLYSTLQFIFHQLFWLVRIVRCTVLYSSYSTSCSDWYADLVYSTLQFIFHQLFWLVRRVRCTVCYSSYSTSCSDWYAEFGVLYVTVHIPPVVLTGTQSSLYCTLQFIFHKFSWLWYAALVVVPVICHIVLIDSLIKLNASREITNYAYYKVKQLYVISYLVQTTIVNSWRLTIIPWKH
jgi:hypothetical protein